MRTRMLRGGSHAGGELEPVGVGHPGELLEGGRNLTAPALFRLSEPLWKAIDRDSPMACFTEEA